MKKTLFLFAICFFSNGVFSQTSVFELNREKARYNQSKSVSQIVSSTFHSITPISEANFTQIAATMEQKDGYVSCTLNEQNKLIVEHENWVELKDIQDVIGQFVAVEPAMRTEQIIK